MRGVNKLVLEVRPEGKYFDKALLFLKPEQAGASQREISDGAERLLRQITQQDCKKAKNNSILSAFIGCAAGAAFTVVSLVLSGALSF